MRHLIIGGMLATLPVTAAAQDVHVESSYIVRQAGKELGRERVVVRSAQDRRGELGLRWELEARRLSGDEVRAVLRTADDGGLDALQLETRDAGGSSVLRAAYRGSRLVISLSGDRVRRARELPADEHSILLDEELHSLLFAARDLATEAGTSLVGIYPRTGKRVSFTARRSQGPDGGTVVQFTGGLTGRMELDAGGRVTHLELPGERVELELLPG